jgi:hypothetical protein
MSGSRVGSGVRSRGLGCGCKQCVHGDHVRTRQCRLVVPRDGQPHAWCGQPTRYVITPYCVHRDGVIRVASDDDPAAGDGTVRLGDSIQRHQATYACSTQHARALIAADQQCRTAYPADSVLSAANTHYEIESFTYEPDELDVPGALHALCDHLNSGRVPGAPGHRRHVRRRPPCR